MQSIGKPIFVIFLFLVFFLTACTKEPPSIGQEYVQVVMFKDVEKKTVYQKLSVFVLATDKDGFEDIEKIYVINDDKNLYWEADQNTAVKPLLNNQTWIGLNSLVMNDLSPFPKGAYRIVVTDLGGESAEREISLDYADVETENVRFPPVSVDNAGIEVKAADCIIWIYDLSGAFIDLVYYTGSTVSIGAVNTKNPKTTAGFTFYVYTYDSAIDMGLVSGPYHYLKP